MQRDYPFVLLITPPFTQLNTPYPATQYLKGYLNTIGIKSFQADLSLELILRIFSRGGLVSIFDTAARHIEELDEDSRIMLQRRALYTDVAEEVLHFLQFKNQTLAHQICSRNYLPEGSRFRQLEDLEWAFGALGIYEKARHLCTLFLEDIGDFITKNIDPHFGFSRYAERLSRTASDFTPILEALDQHQSLLRFHLDKLTDDLLMVHKPDAVLITAPFPGNVFASFLIASRVKILLPECKVIFGGGYANTELRRISDERVFSYFDFITLDDGETPIRLVLEYLQGQRQQQHLKRTFMLWGGVVSYMNSAEEKDVPQREVGVPDYSDLKLDKYLSVIELLNPMHRMWSDGRWNKLTLAHGCYWGKCSFCDISLDYIARYEPVTASVLCDRISQMVEQTGESGFHFVDEAAPPSLLKDLSIELLRRNMRITWWTNIRFENAFTSDLCKLMASAGCIAISGGLEVASDRLLEKMQKGVTVAQVARVASDLSVNGILVHAYLMYGFPTQTAQETIDSLEMVRQMFEEGIVHSAFWHQFAMTAHSPVGLHPEEFGVIQQGPQFKGFAENDYFHEDPQGTDHEKFSNGLKVSLFNYMHGLGTEQHLSSWFDFSVPKTRVPAHYIKDVIEDSVIENPRDHQQILWIGGDYTVSDTNSEQTIINIISPSAVQEVTGDPELLEWFLAMLPQVDPRNTDFHKITVKAFNQEYSDKFGDENGPLTQTYVWYQFRQSGLLVL